MGGDYGPDRIAAYFVNQLRNGETNERSRSVLHDYFETTKQRPDNRWTPDLKQMASYLQNEAVEDDAELAEAFWQRLAEDISRYLEEERGMDPDDTPALPVVADDGLTADIEYAPGGRAVSGPDAGQSNVPDAWMTEIVHLSADDGPDTEENEAYIIAPRYLDEKTGKDRIRTLLEEGYTSEVKDLLQKSVRDNMGGVYDEHVVDIATEMAKYGESEAVQDLINWATGLGKHHEALQLYKGREEGESAAISDFADD